MEKNSPPKIYGVLGYPVKHSLSPAMHNAAFRALEINAKYELFEVRPQDLEEFLCGLDAKNIYGLNVTVPHKEKVLDFVKLDAESSYLRQIRAVNTIVKRDNAWKGFNTDIQGFSRHLKENLDPADKKVALVGAGGAARAVAYCLAKSGAKEIAVFDIDAQKTESVCRMIKELFPKCALTPAESVQELRIGQKELLVNATPVGLKDTDPSPVEKEFLHKNLFVYDLIYNPAETKLLAFAKKAGAKTANGLGMLLYQGMLSFKIWTGKNPPEEVMKKALLEKLAKCRK